MSTVLFAGYGASLDNGDAWRENMPDKVGTMVAETTGPTMIDQEAGAKPMTFRTEERTPGFRMVTDRIMRVLGNGFGGSFSIPHGPRQGGPRLRRSIPTPNAPIQSQRAYGPAGQPAGLVPTSPAYESFLNAGPDAYIGA